MTRYHTYLDSSTPEGQETILGIQQNGSEFGIGISSTIQIENLNILNSVGIGTTDPTETLDVRGNVSVSGITTTQHLLVTGVTTFVGATTLGITSTNNFTSQTLSVSGITTLGVTSTTNLTSQTLSVSGISTLGVATITNLTSQTLSVSGTSSFVNGPLLVTNGSIGIATTNPTSKLYIVGNTLINGITTTSNLTVNSIKYGGSTSTYSGVVGITTVNSDDEQIHFITFNTSTSEVHISNFVSGRRFTIIVRNTADGARNVTIRTSTTTTGHAVVPILVSQSTDTVTDGNVSMGDFNGVKIEIFNINGTIFGHYG